MILTCPACATQYRLKDGAIPPEGRQVRCAACKNAWHQAPEPTDIADDDALTSAPPAPAAVAPPAPYADAELCGPPTPAPDGPVRK